MVVLPSVCFETDVCVDAMRGHLTLPGLAARFIPRAVAWISSITLAELELGVALAARGSRSRDALSHLLEVTSVRAFDERSAATYGGVRRRLRQSGQDIGALDALIGAHALAEGAVLITRNVREFRRIEGLTVLDAGR